MHAEDRRKLRERFKYRCGYCGVRERDVGAELTVDHFHPGSRGGVDDATNWVYCCHACNEFKGDYWQPGSPEQLLNPLCDSIVSHIKQEADGTLRPLTATGAFHIDRLHLNRQQLVEYRREQRRNKVARLAQERVLERIKELEQKIQSLIDIIVEDHEAKE
jgi:HNH endonuclease